MEREPGIHALALSCLLVIISIKHLDNNADSASSQYVAAAICLLQKKAQEAIVFKVELLNKAGKLATNSCVLVALVVLFLVSPRFTGLNYKPSAWSN